MHGGQLMSKSLPVIRSLLPADDKRQQQKNFISLYAAAENLRCADLPCTGDGGEPRSLRGKEGGILFCICFHENGGSVRKGKAICLIDIATGDPARAGHRDAAAKNGSQGALQGRKWL